jgi:hypothetical protein
MSFIKIVNSKGPSTEPWTTPAPTSKHSVELSFTHTHRILWLRYDLIKATTLVVNLYWLLSITYNSRWSTLSNVLEKSNKRSTDTYFSSNAINRSFVILSNVELVLYLAAETSLILTYHVISFHIASNLLSNNNLHCLR